MLIDADNVRNWYMKTYPTDDLGCQINGDLTFDKAIATLNNHGNIYQAMGVGDSVIRERVFTELATRQGVSYGEIYDKWLGTARPSVLRKMDEMKSQVSVSTKQLAKYNSIVK